MRRFPALPSWILSFAWIVCCHLGLAQSPFYKIYSARLQSMSITGVALTGTESSKANAACLAGLTTSTILLTTENRFVNSEIRGLSLQCGLRSGVSDAFALGIDYYGIKEYNQQNYQLAYARKLSDKFSLGTSYNYTLFQSDLNHNGGSTLHLGALWEGHKALCIGLSWHQFISHGGSISALPSWSLIGALRYKLSSLLHLYTELDKTDSYPTDWRIGLNYIFSKSLEFRTGISTLYNVFAAGIGYVSPLHIRFDFGVKFIQSLGYTPSLSIQYNFNNQQSPEP